MSDPISVTVADRVTVTVGGGPPGATGVWGGITGTLANQTDLTAALALKAGENSTVNYIKFDTTPTGVPTTEGTLSWNELDKTVNLQTDMTDVVIQLGQELQAPTVKNITGSTIPNGTAVYISGGSGQKSTVAPASASNATHVNSTIGVATHDIGTSPGFGKITTFGLVRGVNTHGLTEGAPIYLDSGGAWTTTLPSSGAVVRVGWVVVAGTNGTIFVHIERLSAVSTQISDSTSTGRSLLTAADAAAALTTLGATTVGSNLLAVTTPLTARWLRVNTDGTVSALNAADTLTALGSTTVGSNLLTVTTPLTARWLRVNTDGTVSALNAADTLTALGATTVGSAILSAANPSAVRYLRINADNTVTALSREETLADLVTGIATSPGDPGTVYSNLGVLTIA